MKIALLGYGKMGKIIEDLALERGHKIILKVTGENANYPLVDLEPADVAIEFSRPDAVLRNIFNCFTALVPVVVGTTGWYDRLGAVTNECDIQKGRLFYASNFSIGMNMFFEINKQLAKLMNSQPGYSVKMKEIHHTQKLDAPSGTAITLAEQIIGNLDRLSGWTMDTTPGADKLPIEAQRTGDVPGTHIVTWDSDIDTIRIEHAAKNRKGFALGAILAAEWLVTQKPGCYNMQDMLGSL